MEKMERMERMEKTSFIFRLEKMEEKFEI